MADVKIVDFSAGQPDPWDTVGKALQVAGTVYGIKDARDKLALLKKQTEAEAPAKKLAYESELQKYTQAKETADRQKRGEFLQEEYAKLYKPASQDKDGGYSPDAQPIKVIEGDQVKTVMSVPKSDSALNEALKAMTIQNLGLGISEKKTKIASPAYQFEQLPKENQDAIKKLTDSNSNKIAIKNQIDSTISILNSEDTPNDQKLSQAKQMIKVLNSTEGKDAVGAEEASRLAERLQRFSLNPFSEGGLRLGSPDLKGFTEQARLTSQGLANASNSNSELIKKLYSGTSFADIKQSAPMKKQETGLKVGTVQEGYKFRGGDPADKNNWEKVK